MILEGEKRIAKKALAVAPADRQYREQVEAALERARKVL
jgi:hypothetical protein